jgi:hypothetical protein
MLIRDRIRVLTACVNAVAIEVLREHGDPQRALRAGASYLLRAAADLERRGDARCRKCQDSDLLSRVARIDARTREFFEWIDADDLKSGAPYSCGDCGEDLTEEQVEGGQ